MDQRRSAKEILDRALVRLGSASGEGMESARERVLESLRSRAAGFPANATAESWLDARPASLWRLRQPYVIAAAVVVVLSVLSIAHLRNAAIATPAVVESADGSQSRLSFGETLRTEAGAVVSMADGSHIEMRAQAELSFERADDGVRIRLNKGSIIVSAAKQRTGHLYVQTKDATASVVGTVFLVSAEELGTRVVVIEGKVQVRQGGTLKELRSGEQVATNPLTVPLSIAEQISWSRNASTYLTLLQELRPALQQPAVAPPQRAPKKRTEARVAFEVASVKPTTLAQGGERGVGGRVNVSSRPGGEPCGSPTFPQINPGRFVTRDTTLLALILWAYGKDCQIFHGSDLIVGGPGWIKSDGFDIEAVIPEDSPKYTTAQLRTGNAPKLQMMLQTLLADRFNLVARREMKEMPVYVLTLGKSGPKLTPSKDDDAKREGLIVPRLQASMHLIGGKKTMADLARLLAQATFRPVLDRTGIIGEFNFDVEYGATDNQLGAEFPGMSGPSIFTALEEQLGLKLEAAKAPMEVLVIERVEKPSEN